MYLILNSIIDVQICRHFKLPSPTIRFKSNQFNWVQFNLMHSEKVDKRGLLADPPSPSSCPRSYWMTPMKKIKEFLIWRKLLFFDYYIDPKLKSICKAIWLSWSHFSFHFHFSFISTNTPQGYWKSLFHLHLQHRNLYLHIRSFK